MTNFLRYADLERYLFEDVRRRFHSEHSISAFDLFSIIIWKANRAKSRIARRLLRYESDLEHAARRLSGDLWQARGAEDRLRVLMSDWGFRLPMASAILTVLWPKEFTVYDTRVCGQLGAFHSLAHRSCDRVWGGYAAYREAVRRAAPTRLTLRDKDRYLWGRSAAEQLKRELRSGFGARRKAGLTSRSSGPAAPAALRRR